MILVLFIPDAEDVDANPMSFAERYSSVYVMYQIGRERGAFSAISPAARQLGDSSVRARLHFGTISAQITAVNRGARPKALILKYCGIFSCTMHVPDDNP